MQFVQGLGYICQTTAEPVDALDVCSAGFDLFRDKGVQFVVAIEKISETVFMIGPFSLVSGGDKRTFGGV